MIKFSKNCFIIDFKEFLNLLLQYMQNNNLKNDQMNLKKIKKILEKEIENKNVKKLIIYKNNKIKKNIIISILI